jgi:CRISPR-associated RAMP protein (TIGR02581 family)
MITKLERRYLITGTLELTTPLHLGGSDASQGSSDQPVARDNDGRPYIPGSSLKGAFRSTVEKLAATVDLHPHDYDVIDQSGHFATDFSRRRRNGQWDDDMTVEHVKTEWPITSHLFGTPYTAGKISFLDALLHENQEYRVLRRDGVGIDRDSERAVDNLLYNYEVVPGSLQFSFEVQIDNPTDNELGLACLGFSELRSGFFALGGKRSSGLGRCQLHQTQLFILDLQVEDAQERLNRFQRYLIGTTNAEKFTVRDFDPFVNEAIERLLHYAQERKDADATSSGK